MPGVSNAEATSIQIKSIISISRSARQTCYRSLRHLFSTRAGSPRWPAYAASRQGHMHRYACTYNAAPPVDWLFAVVEALRIGLGCDREVVSKSQILVNLLR
ncbi:hypothetical protein K449DRAFT_11894 [Hypoxylon sp. EC38]|nr:hypothetical protein K449DRAFT_11894 [Hypoxylon sp. EC38]